MNKADIEPYIDKEVNVGIDGKFSNTTFFLNGVITTLSNDALTLRTSKDIHLLALKSIKSITLSNED